MWLNNLLLSLTELPQSAQLVVVFLFAALVGSFLNVVIYRLPIMMERAWQAQAREILQLPAVEQEKLTLTLPRSRCRHCGRTIKALENIPVISYIVMRGKCQGCGTGISFFYPLVELMTAALATFVFWALGGGPAGFFGIFFAFALIALTAIDIKVQLLPDALTLSLMWAGIILSFFQVYMPLQWAVIGAIVGYSSLWLVATGFKLLFKKDGMGLGDAKLLAAIFTWVPIKFLPIVLVIACLIGITVTLLQRLMQGRAMLNNPIPFGPYLALGGVLAFLYGTEMLSWYLSFFRY